MKIEKFQLRGNSSVCAGAFQLLRGRAPAQLTGNIDDNPNIARGSGVKITVLWDVRPLRLVSIGTVEAADKPSSHSRYLASTYSVILINWDGMKSPKH
jgi:hypothetical protein